MSSKKPKKVDLRKLMKERRENLNSKREKIDSPFAKYSNSGLLSCLICNVTIKDNNLWSSHISGKIHKENLQKSKKSSSDKESISNNSTKRNVEQPPASKKLKTEEVKPVDDFKFKKPAAPITASYSSSDDSGNEMDCESTPAKPQTSVQSSNLPVDFFDGTISSTASVLSEVESKENPVNEAEQIPEGFFDDPVLDAKARKIEYKDPMDEEWEKFQKTIAEETNVSNSIMKDDMEESTLERDISVIDDQIHLWEWSNNLQVLADDAKMKAANQDDDMEGASSSDSDFDEDDLLDWRSKSLKKA